MEFLCTQTPATSPLMIFNISQSSESKLLQQIKWTFYEQAFRSQVQSTSLWPKRVARWGRFLYRKRGRLRSANNRTFLLTRISVTRWLAYYLIFGHLQQWKIPKLCKTLPKVGSKPCQILNLTSNKARTGPWYAARFKPEVHPRSTLTKSPE